MGFRRSVDKTATKTTRYRARYQVTPAPDPKVWEKAPYTFSTRRAANAWLDDMEEAVAAGRAPVSGAEGEMRLDDYAERFFRLRTKYADSTRSNDDINYRKHVAPRFGKMRLCDIHRGQIDEWAAELNTSGAASQSVSAWYFCFRKILDHAVQHRAIPFNPFPPAGQHGIRSVEKERDDRWLDSDEIQALVDAFDPRYKAAILVMGYCGLRPGEMAALRLNDFIDAPHNLRVDESMSRGQVQELSQMRTKTQASNRTVERIPSTVTTALAHHLEEHRVGARSKDFIFVSPDGQPLNLINWRRRFFNLAVGRAKLSDDPRLPTPNDLRHSAATIWLDSGMSARHVAERLGHSTTEMVDRHYGHRVMSRDGELARELDRRIIAAAGGEDAVDLTAERKRRRA